ncbi:hypothetical protein [Peptostreptococcus equinus]|uniref:Uncharacterized protein n=1 Tax=Peptostreptococcus equinus TaxID=3003601 RepID=A0ABY7JQE5_9FIRM|nr:hypothetical protein [Peptostreptococcus sp. CBA3647]WAW15379.1 hypothetical protein O0R46_02735 [Peptostreptococcus sp. CBA3647]
MRPNFNDIKSYQEFEIIKKFKFKADMVVAWRKVKDTEDSIFTFNDMMDIYYGKSNYDRYDKSVC